MPDLLGIDHVHVYVRDRARAETWYGEVLGMKRVEALAFWATDDGPLTLQNEQGTIHLALFESSRGPDDNIAFKVTGPGFIEWRRHLAKHGIETRITDHDAAWSMYFKDPDDNLHEITTWDCDHVRGAIGETF